MPWRYEAAQALEIVTADLDVQLAQLEEARQRDDLVLRGQQHAGRADGAGKAEHLAVSEALAEAEAAVAIDGRARHRLVERRVGRPLRHRLVAAGALVEADVDGVELVEQVGAARDQQVRQARRHARVDHGRAVLWPGTACRSASCSAWNGLSAWCEAMSR